MNTRHHYLRLLRTFALAALTAAAIAACTDDNGDPDGREPITPDAANPGIAVNFTADTNPDIAVNFTADTNPDIAVNFTADTNPDTAPGTRTILTPTADGGFTVKWKGTDNYQRGEYDKIHIWASNGSNYTPTTSDVSSELKPENDQDKLTLPSTGTWKFRAIYGSNLYTIDTGEPMVNLYNLRQFKPDNTNHIARFDFSVATAEEDIAAENDEMPLDISLKFGHKLSALQLRVTNATDAELTIEEIRLAVVGEQMADYRVFDVTAGDWKAGSETRRDYLTLTIVNPAALAPNATPQNFHMLFFPGYANTDMTITVVTNSGEYTLKKTAPASPGFKAGTNYMTDITIQSSNLTDKETWTEYVNISTAEELAAFRNQVNGGDNYQGKIVRLLNDIDLSGETWTTPIGTASKPFKGTFDGGGHLISNLSVDNGSNGYAGLFGYVYKGMVTTTIQNAGGIAGYLDGSTVENCIFEGNVSGRGSVGGIAGQSMSNSRIAGCHTKGTVTTTATTSENAGGIAGTNNGSAIDGCYSEAEVKAGYQGAGGIAGSNDNSGTVTHCYATGKVSSRSSVGGIVGVNDNSTVTDCIALNPGLTRTEGSETYFGRIVGYNQATVTSCAAYDGMTITDNASQPITSDATSVAGDDLIAAACLAKDTYTSRGFTELSATASSITPGWTFDITNTPWRSLPWNSAFRSFDGITETNQYRIAVPDHLNGGGTN